MGEWQDDDPTPWRRKVNYTDMPEGTWMFYVTPTGTPMDDKYTCILPTEY